MGPLKAFERAALPQFTLPISRTLATLWLGGALLLLVSAVAFHSGSRWFWAFGLLARSKSLLNRISRICLHLSAIMYEHQAQSDCRKLPTFEPTSVERFAGVSTNLGWNSKPNNSAAFSRTLRAVLWTRRRTTYLSTFFTISWATRRRSVCVFYPPSPSWTHADGKWIEAKQSRCSTTLFLAPSQLVNPGLVWETVAPHHVRATYTRGQQTISAELAFDSQTNQLIDFVSEDRSAASASGRSFVPMRWRTPVRSYRFFGPRRLMNVAEARWEPPSGGFSYVELELTEIEFNVRSRP